MVHTIKKHYYTLLLIVFSGGILFTNAPYTYLEDEGGGFWLYGWCASALLVGMHECESVLMDYITDKTKVPLFKRLIGLAVWGLFIIALGLEYLNLKWEWLDTPDKIMFIITLELEYLK